MSLANTFIGSAAAIIAAVGLMTLAAPEADAGMIGPQRQSDLAQDAALFPSAPSNINRVMGVGTTHTILTVDATVTTIPASLVGSSINVGDSAHFIWTIFDQGAVDSEPSLVNTGIYDGVTSVLVEIGNNVRITSSAARTRVDYDIAEFIDVFSISSIPSMGAFSVLGNVNGLSVDSVQYQVSGADGPFINDVLSDALPVLGDFGPPGLALLFNGEGLGFSFDTMSVLSVPTPGTIALFGAGGVLAVRRRRDGYSSAATSTGYAQKYHG